MSKLNINLIKDVCREEITLNTICDVNSKEYIWNLIKEEK